MNRTVPTLWGVIVILLVALLVAGIYNVKLYGQLAGNSQVVGSQIHARLTDTQAPTALDQAAVGNSEYSGVKLPPDPNRPAAQLRRAQHREAIAAKSIATEHEKAK